MSGLPALAKPRCIKASHRRRRRLASGQSVQRYYDPALVAFLSVDPVTVNTTSGWNFCRYCYADGNPYKFTDPDGRIAYQNGRDIYIPIFYKGKGATREFISRQIQHASQLVGTSKNPRDLGIIAT